MSSELWSRYLDGRCAAKVTRVIREGRQGGVGYPQSGLTTRDVLEHTLPVLAAADDAQPIELPLGLPDGAFGLVPRLPDREPLLFNVPKFLSQRPVRFEVLDLRTRVVKRP